MASIPTPFLAQVIPTVGQTLEAFSVPDNTSLASMSVAALNASGQTGTYTWWLVPAGELQPQNRHLQQIEHPLTKGAKNIDMSYSVGAGYRVFVAASVPNMVFTINGMGHMD